MWLDSHAHLSSDSIWEKIDGVVERAKEAGVGTLVNICTDKVTLERGLALAERYPHIYNAAATTPHDVEKEGEELFETMKEAAESGKLCAVGETGLDYYYAHSPKNLQKEFLRRYLDLADACNLPVVIHCREAFDDLFAICDEIYRDKPLILHCFTGSMEEAREVVKRGWMLSISGIVTFKRSDELRRVAAWTPLDQLLLETDTPYLAPQSKRGKPNEPGYLPEVGEAVALERGISIAEIARATQENGRAIFGLPRQ